MRTRAYGQKVGVITSVLTFRHSIGQRWGAEVTPLHGGRQRQNAPRRVVFHSLYVFVLFGRSQRSIGHGISHASAVTNRQRQLQQPWTCSLFVNNSVVTLCLVDFFLSCLSTILTAVLVSVTGSAKQDVSGGMHVASGTCRISTAAPMDPTHNPHEASDVKSSPYKNVSQQPLSSSDQLSTETGNAQVPSSSASHGMQPMHPPPQAGCEAGLAPGIQGEGADDLPLAPLTSPTAFGADAARIFDAVLGGLGDEEGHDFMHLGSGEYPMSITPQSIALPTASPGTAMCHHDMQEASPGPQPVPPFPPFMDTPFAQANAMAAVPGALDMGQPHPPYHTTHTLPASGSNGAPLPPLPQTHSGHAWYPGSNPGDIAAPRTSSPSRQPQPPPSTSAFHISMPGSPSHAPAHPLQQPRRHPGPGPGPTTSTYPYPYAYSQPNLAPAPAPHRLSRSQLPSDTDPPHPPAPQHRAPPAPSHSDCSMGPGPSRTSTAGATAFKQLRISCSGNMGPARSSGMDDGRAHGHMQWSSSPQAGPRPGGRAPHVAYEEQGHSPAVVVDSPTKCLQHMHMGGADHPSPGR